MKYAVTIRLNRTGTTVQARYDLPGMTAEGVRFNWKENNWSCDCNRGLDFRRALYPNPPPNNPFWNDSVTRCTGKRPRYHVPFIDLEDGTRIWIDDEARK